VDIMPKSEILGVESNVDHDDCDWIFDFVMETFKSPIWEAPVMSFIDENCIVFDREDENKLAYSKLHDEFRDLVEELLVSKLNEVGISIEDFAYACEIARSKRGVNRAVFDQMLAVDDYRVFKKLMAKRNVELELEAVQALKEESEAATVQTAMGPADHHRESKDAAGEGAAHTSSAEGPETQRMDAAISANLVEMEVRHRQEEAEQAELQTAIQISIAMEEERLRTAKLDAKREAGDDAAGAGSQPLAMPTPAVALGAEAKPAPASSESAKLTAKPDKAVPPERDDRAHVNCAEPVAQPKVLPDLKSISSSASLPVLENGLSSLSFSKPSITELQARMKSVQEQAQVSDLVRPPPWALTPL
jgi:hypothetical protein